MTCPSGEQLREYLDERLDNVERDAIERHTETCANCQQRLGELSGATFPVRGRQKREHEPNEDFLRRLKQGISASSIRWGTDSKPSLGPISRTAPPAVPGYEMLHELGR